MSPKQFVLAFLLLISLTSTHGTMYEIIDHSARAPGGNKYADELSTHYKARVLFRATEEVLNTFNQKEGEGKKYDTVTLQIESFPSPHAVASTIDNVIRLNTRYLQRYRGEIKEEFAGVVYHEMTHVWQWTGNGMAPRGLINGIADYVRLKGGYASKGWPRMGSGSRWDDGYAVTASFLDYCNGLKHGFVAELNALMKDSYSETFFIQLLGKPVRELWRDYKLAYGTTRISSSEEGYQKPYTRTRPFDNSVPWKKDDVPKSNAHLKPSENDGYFRIEVNGVVLDSNNFQQNDIAESAQDLAWLAELSTMIEKNSAPNPSINSRKLDPNWQRTKGRTSRSEIEKPVTKW
ncbi:uncharacterized protein LOC125315090 [Rhodamnia argentea]|uniref:Uncharacterized protein LOC125315090 n=1 Tax=Rhodamnia argentea TaxID=178133 RepID=A0ABM3HEP3_9MYRT|nr:uncharacterized protein LOC125315090 [Rhodamnia argentea]